jgi:hypothetical protein
VQWSDNYELATLHPGLSYMASGASDCEGQFIEVGQGFPRVFLGSRAWWWTMPGMILGDVALWHQLYLAAKPSHVGVDVDGLAVIPRSEIEGTKPPYVCPGCFIHTYSNNMINRFHVQ